MVELSSLTHQLEVLADVATVAQWTAALDEATFAIHVSELNARQLTISSRVLDTVHGSWITWPWVPAGQSTEDNCPDQTLLNVELHACRS